MNTNRHGKKMILQIAAGLLGCYSFAAEKPEDFTADGVTGTFADNQLTINVESGKTCTFDYASRVTTGWVTNIVKTGAGAITPAVASAYQGSFDFREGSVTLNAAGQLGADNVGTVRKASGVTMTCTGTMATGKKVYLAGTVSQTTATTVFKSCDIVLTGALTFKSTASAIDFATSSRVDVNGSNLTLTPKAYAKCTLSGVTFTNGNDQTASTISVSNERNLTINNGTSFWGGSRNKVTTGSSSTRFVFSGEIGGDWTINPSANWIYANSGKSANDLNDKICGTYKAQNASSSYNDDYYNAKDFCLTFGGPVTGSTAMSVKGGTINFLSSANDYTGALSITDKYSNKLRSCIYVWNGANFSAGSVSLGNADFWMDDDTAFAIPALKQVNGTVSVGTCKVYGGPTADNACGRATIAGFTKTGGTTLTFDTPARVTGTTDIQTGTLKLGSGMTADELPVFDNLVFADGTTFDMNGKDLAIGSLTGIPTVANAGTLTITGTWTVDGDALADGGVLDLGAGKLVLTSTAAINVVKGTKDVPQTPIVIAAGGIEDSSTGDWRLSEDGVLKAKVAITTVGGGSVSPAFVYALPGETVTVTAVPNAGNFVVWSGDTAAIQNEGHDVFANEITIKVGDATALTATFADLASAKPTDFSATGVTGAFADRTLTITVASGATCTYDYASALASGWVTNVVKTGAGAITPAVAAEYRGSFDFQEGSVTLNAAGQLGADNLGIVRKASGVTMTCTGTMATGKKVYLAGTVTQTSQTVVFKSCDIVLTGNLTWNGSACSVDFATGSRVDANGHALSLTPGQYKTCTLSGVAFTNGNELAASSISVADERNVKLCDGTSFWGGSRNSISTGFYSVTLNVFGEIDGDWTLNANATYVYSTSGRSVNNLSDRFNGTFVVGSNSSVYNSDAWGAKNYCLTFGGPVKGDKNMNVRGGTVNFLGSGTTYSGVLSITDEKSNGLRTGIYVWDGANLTCKAGSAVSLGNADFWMGTNTAFAIPALKQVNGTSSVGTCKVYGGPTADKACGRATIAGFTKTGGTTLTFDTPAQVTGTTDIQTGTLALGSGTTADELPVFDTLVFAEGTTFDMNGKDLTVGNLSGIPTITNPGTLTITGNWTVSGDALVDGGKLELGAGSLVFGSGATITIVRGTQSLPHEVVVATAAGGIEGSPVSAGSVRRTFKVRGGTSLLADAHGLMLFVR